MPAGIGIDRSVAQALTGEGVQTFFTAVGAERVEVAVAGVPRSDLALNGQAIYLREKSPMPGTGRVNAREKRKYENHID